MPSFEYLRPRLVPFTSTLLSFLLLLLLSLPTDVCASITVYKAAPLGGTAAAPTSTACIGAIPCDGATITTIPPQASAEPPAPAPDGSQPPPDGSQPATTVSAIPIQLLTGGAQQGLSIPIPQGYFGFSLELSVINKLIGEDGSRINPIFLNLMATITTRAGRVPLRAGGNSQEDAVLIDGPLTNGESVMKIGVMNTTTKTPELLLSSSLIYAMGNISTNLPIFWFLGVPFNSTDSPRPELAELGERVLGSNLLGLQLGNEPDLFHINNLRNTTYDQNDYFTEFGEVLQAYVNDPKITNKNSFVGPSICCGGESNGNVGWTPEMVWDTGYLDSYGSNLGYIAVEHYPTNNCNSSGATPEDPNQLLSTIYLNHPSVQSLSQPYINSSQIAVQLNKPFVMFETNTASCGGFSGLSDSFAATIWSVDYAMSMANFNFSLALWHVGGQSDYYNPFTPPSTNQTKFRQWTIGSTFYAALVVAEALGNTGQSQVADLNLNNNDPVRIGYTIYENGEPARVLLINSITDPSGASNFTAYVSLGGNNTGQANATPASVQVKYLLSPSTAEKFDISWAGQTFGGAWASDGRLMGTESILTVPCDQTNNVCAISVPAPGAALVFLSRQAFTESEGTQTLTFSTSTTATNTNKNTATVPPMVLATSNGRGGQMWLGVGSTSRRSASGARRAFTSGFAGVVDLVMGGGVGWTVLLGGGIVLGALLGGRR